MKSRGVGRGGKRPRAGRPAAAPGEKRTHELALALNDAQWALLQGTARESNIKAQDVLRGLLDSLVPSPSKPEAPAGEKIAHALFTQGTDYSRNMAGHLHALNHAVPPDSEKALCGFTPGPSSAGWDRGQMQPGVSCERCLSAVEKNGYRIADFITGK